MHEHLPSGQRFAARIMESVGALFPIATLSMGWFFGGYFTLWGLQFWFHFPYEQIGLVSWLIPITISCAEVIWWPFPTAGRWQVVRGWRLAFFTAIAGFDVFSTGIGFWEWLNTGGMVGPTLAVGIALVGGYALTFGPERLARRVWLQLKETWGFGSPLSPTLAGTRPYIEGDGHGSFYHNRPSSPVRCQRRLVWPLALAGALCASLVGTAAHAPG